MNKREFLKATGLLGMASMIPGGPVLATGNGGRMKAGGCVLIPGETAGPFPLDLTENSTFFRQDITEGQTGVPFRLRLRILGLDNCETMPSLRVNIWHCTNGGLYSGYSQANNPGQAGLTYLRGYQYTDANGEVEFLSIFPGWYNGRICHIHFQVYVNSNYAAISQLTFPVDTKNAIYLANPTLYPNGTDPMTLASDNIFNNGYQYQMATLEPDGEGGYTSYLEVTIEGAGVSTGYTESLAAQQFTLEQNRPNPYHGRTTIPVTLHTPSDVLLELWDLQGRKVHGEQHPGLKAGPHLLPLDLEALGLPSAGYVYQVQVTNAQGVFRSSRMMTAQR